MSTRASQPRYIPIAGGPRIIAFAQVLLILTLIPNQVWYVVYSEYMALTVSFKDPLNDIVNLYAHALAIGLLLGYAVIALRSAISGYAPTRGMVTYRWFLALYPAAPSGPVNIREDPPVAPVSLVTGQRLEEDTIDACYREETHTTPHLEDLLVEDQTVQQSRTTRALIVCPACSEDKDVSDAQMDNKLVQVRKILYFFLSFFERLTLSVTLVIGSVIKQRLVTFRNQLAAFLAFLATRTKDTRLTWEELESHPIFDNVTKQSLYAAKNELKRKINAVIKILDPDHPEVDVLERDEHTKNYTHVALSDNWYRELPAKLLTYHARVLSIQADSAHTPNNLLKELRPMYEYMILTYEGRGFLGGDLERDKDNRWFWAEGYYLHVRDDQLTCLFYCAEREEEASRKTNNSQIQQECRTRAARLWEVGALTAMTYHPDLGQGEYALRRYLKLCDPLSKHGAARKVANQYCQRMVRLAPEAQLHPDTLARMEAIGYSQHSRKMTKVQKLERKKK